MTDIRELLHAGAHRPSTAPDLDGIARDAVRKRTGRSAGAAVAGAAVIALLFGVDWVGSTTVEITEPVGTVTVPRLPHVDPSVASASLPDAVTVLEDRDGATEWELGFAIDPASSMLHLLFSAGGSSAGTRMPVDAAGRVWPGALTTSDHGQFAYGTSAPEVAAFELEVADGTQVDVPATRVHVNAPPMEFTTFAASVTDDVTKITARNRHGDIVAVYDRDDPVGVVLFQVLQDQPWLSSNDDSPRAPFEPTTFQDQYVVTTSVAMELFGERAAGGRLVDGRIELAVTRATPADTDRLRAELSTDPRLADAADRFRIVPIEHTRGQLDAAQADLLDDVPDDLRQRISVTVEPHEDRVTIYVTDERESAAVRETFAELPDFVHIVIDPEQQGHPADS